MPATRALIAENIAASNGFMDILMSLFMPGQAYQLEAFVFGIIVPFFLLFAIVFSGISRSNVLEKRASVVVSAVLALVGTRSLTPFFLPGIQTGSFGEDLGEVPVIDPIIDGARNVAESPFMDEILWETGNIMESMRDPDFFLLMVGGVLLLIIGLKWYRR